MTNFFKKKKRLDPYTEAVARTFNKINKKVTPSEVAKYLKIHPNTAKDRIRKLQKAGYISCKKDGNKLMCKRRRMIRLN